MCVLSVYYNNNGPTPGPMHIQTRASAPTAGQQPYQKQKRRGLTIVDPNTNQDISDSIYNADAAAAGSDASSQATSQVVSFPVRLLSLPLGLLAQKCICCVNLRCKQMLQVHAFEFCILKVKQYVAFCSISVCC